MINIANLADSLPILLKDDVTFEELKRDFPDILADLVTFKSNPNCSCKGRVVKFFSEKLTSEPGVLDKYIKNPEVLTDELRRVAAQRQANNYSGRVITIPKSEESWKNFSNEMSQGKFFRGFSVIEKENELVVYFL